jgi:hypothetical protein
VLMGVGLALWGRPLIQTLEDGASLSTRPSSPQTEQGPASGVSPAAPDKQPEQLPVPPAATGTRTDNSRTSAPAASTDSVSSRPIPSPAPPAPSPTRSAPTRVEPPPLRGSAAPPVVPSPSPTRSAPSAATPAPSSTRTAPSQPEVTSAASTGKLFAITRPIGAQVFLDDKLVGTTPLFLSGLALGPHQVRLELEGFKTYSSPIRIEPTDRFHLAVQLEE